MNGESSNVRHKKHLHLSILLPHCIITSLYTAYCIYSAHITIYQLYLIGFDWKILSVRKELIPSVFLTLNAQSIMSHTGNLDAMRLLAYSVSA